MTNLSPRENPPVTAASIVAAILGIITAFDIGNLTAEQTTAVGAVLAIVAAVVAQRFTTPLTTPDRLDHADHANGDEFHGNA